MSVKHTISVLVFIFLATGCLSRQLHYPAEDHYIQTRVIADACEAEGYGAGKCTQADLEAMVAQAECIMKLTQNQPCGPGAKGQ